MNNIERAPRDWVTEQEACDNIHNYNSWDIIQQRQCVGKLTNRNWMKAFEQLLSLDGFDINKQLYEVGGYNIIQCVFDLYIDYESRSSMRRLVVACNTAKGNTDFLRILVGNHEYTPQPGWSWRMGQERIALLLEAGAEWPYDLCPEGCDLLHKINAAKECCTTLLHALKGVIPKDLINEIVMEIYDNRMTFK